jgi:hypothetical protein
MQDERRKIREARKATKTDSRAIDLAVEDRGARQSSRATSHRSVEGEVSEGATGKGEKPPQCRIYANVIDRGRSRR